MMMTRRVPTPMYMEAAYPSQPSVDSDHLAVSGDRVRGIGLHAVESGTAGDDVAMTVAHEDSVVALVAADRVGGRIDPRRGDQPVVAGPA